MLSSWLRLPNSQLVIVTKVTQIDMGKVCNLDGIFLGKSPNPILFYIHKLLITFFNIYDIMFLRGGFFNMAGRKKNYEKRIAELKENQKKLRKQERELKAKIEEKEREIVIEFIRKEYFKKNGTDCLESLEDFLKFMEKNKNFLREHGVIIENGTIEHGDIDYSKSIQAERLAKLQEKQKELNAQERELTSQMKQEKREERIKHFIEIGKAVYSVLGDSYQDGDVEKLIDFLKMQNQRGNYFTKAMRGRK